MTASTALRTSPLAGREAELRAAGMREIPFTAAINLRVRSSAAADAVGSALGFGLPVIPNTACHDGRRAALWLGPDEWLLVGPDGDGPALAATARSALGAASSVEASFSVVDVSANRTTIELSGARAREVLAKGCSIDLHPRAFRVDSCAQTLLGKTQVILWQTDDAPSYRLLVRHSFAGYLADWLLDAAWSEW